MSEPFLAEIRMVGFNFAPRGWAFCDGQILPINQNQSLYSLLGTIYGGDGRTSFALPDLRGRVPIHEGQGSGGSNHPIGSRGGEETHILSTSEMPTHSHQMVATTAGANQPSPANNFLAAAPPTIGNAYTDSSTNAALKTSSVTASGGGQGRDNMQPYIAVNFCIALQGLFPSRN